MRYQVRHQTRYRYAEPVAMSYNRVFAEPRSCEHQRHSSSLLNIDPEPAQLHRSLDYFGNPVSFFTLQQAHHDLTVTVRFEVDVTAPPIPLSSDPWESVVAAVRGQALEAARFAFDSPFIQRGRELAHYARGSFPPGTPILEGALDLNRRIHREMEFDPKATDVSTVALEVLDRGRGVCQDFAHLMIGCLRSLGLAARYVSGYLLTQPPPGQPRLVGADASHAWVDVYCPPHGWVQLDPTNDQTVSDQHILLSWGRDYSDVSPLRGVVLGGGKHRVRVAVDVLPLELAGS